MRIAGTARSPMYRLEGLSLAALLPALLFAACREEPSRTAAQPRPRAANAAIASRPDAGPAVVSFRSALALEVYLRRADGTEALQGSTRGPTGVRFALPPGGTWFVKPREPVGSLEALRALRQEASKKAVPGVAVSLAASLGGVLLDELNRFHQLVSLRGDGLTGAQIARLTASDALREIGLGRIDDATLGVLTRFSALEVLRAGGGKPTAGALARLQALPRLRTISFPFISLDKAGLRALAGIQGLSDLDLGHAKLSWDCLDALAAFRGLKRLILGGVELGSGGPLEIGPGAVRGMARNAALIELDLSETGLTDAALRPLKGLSSLRRLNLSGTKVGWRSLSALGSLHKLTDLDLSSTRAWDKTLAPLRRLRSLRILDLGGTLISDRGLARILGRGRVGPALERLVLARTGITDPALARLRSSRALKELDLGTTLVTDEGLKHLVGLKSLKNLGLSHTRVSDKGLEILRKLPSLETLGLDGCPRVSSAAVRAAEAWNPGLLISADRGDAASDPPEDEDPARRIGMGWTLDGRYFVMRSSGYPSGEVHDAWFGKVKTLATEPELRAWLAAHQPLFARSSRWGPGGWVAQAVVSHREPDMEVKTESSEEWTGSDFEFSCEGPFAGCVSDLRMWVKRGKKEGASVNYRREEATRWCKGTSTPYWTRDGSRIAWFVRGVGHGDPCTPYTATIIAHAAAPVVEVVLPEKALLGRTFSALVKRLQGERWALRVTAREAPFASVTVLAKQEFQNEARRLARFLPGRPEVGLAPAGNASDIVVSFVSSGVRLPDGGSLQPPLKETRRDAGPPGVRSRPGASPVR